MSELMKQLTLLVLATIVGYNVVLVYFMYIHTYVADTIEALSVLLPWNY